ncbi:LuxR C-terminal-related transcriptional regulator [Kitasatospora sp. NPDC051170]|uniref:LuxR C-terminal-related transcriptional regulator n=1 Tax=Kitasatospora sp. NPDC051170 TaxID=3364056 RepID=UPI00378BF314
MPDTLLDDAARELYRTVLRDGGRLRLTDIHPVDEPAVEQLVELGLLVPRALDAAYTAVNPRAVSERISGELLEEGARLVAQAAFVPTLLDDLVKAYDAAPRSPVNASSGVEYVAGKFEIRHRIEQIVNDHPSESLLMQPGGPRPPDQLAHASEANRRFLDRGGSLRTIYEASARLDPATVAFVADCTELGASFRVLPLTFTRLMIFGRAIAVVPAAWDHSVAAFVEEAAVVDFLVRDFELHWQRAEGVNWAALAAGPTDSLIQDQVGDLLAQGLAQKGIATRLGVSERTVAGHIARLRELYDAETLFQLGWQMKGARGA